MAKIIRTMLVAVAFAAVVVGCSAREKTAIERWVEQANAQCPVDMGRVGQMTAVTFDAKSNMVHYVYAIDESAVSLDAFASGDFARRSLALMTRSDEGRAALKQFADEGVGCVVTYRSATSGRHVTVEITTDQLRRISEMPPTGNPASLLIDVKSIAEAENARCPMVVDSGMTVTRVYDDGQRLAYICEMDERIYEMNQLDATRNEARSEIAKSFATDEMRAVLLALIANGHGLRYWYVGRETRNDVIIDFTSAELRDYLVAQGTLQTNGKAADK